MIVNRQNRYTPNRRALQSYLSDLKRALRLGRREFNLCLVTDREIRRLNNTYRGKDRPTDVLSFPWQENLERSPLVLNQAGRSRRGEAAVAGFRNFLGDVVISVETARRNARRARHAPLDEIRGLILHGVLHLLGYDHERDQGEMTRLERSLRQRLGVGGPQQEASETGLWINGS